MTSEIVVVNFYALRDPDVVSRVTIENPSPLAVNVSVRPANGVPAAVSVVAQVATSHRSCSVCTADERAATTALLTGLPR